jgi:hypothetical protein
MRAVDLTTNKGGINRLRVKGAALQDSLYDLENGYITSARTIKGRPGTRRLHTLPAGTVGLVTFNGRLRTFATTQLSGMPDDVDLTVLRSPDGADRTLARIHFAEPFLGFLYVVAEFDDGNIYHYWLRDAAEWEAETVYDSGTLVRPTTGSTGVVFRAGRAGSSYPRWVAGAARVVGDKIEPAVYNGFYYEVIAVSGENPRSGQEEPDWPAVEGAQVVESADFSPILPPPPPSPPPTSTPPSDTSDRYTYEERQDFLDIE